MGLRKRADLAGRAQREPNDDAGGGTLSFHSLRAITGLSSKGFRCDDGTGSPPAQVNHRCWRRSGPLDTNNDTTNTRSEALTFPDAAGVSKMDVTLTDSGAIDDITVGPVPAAVWLFGSALLGVIAIGPVDRAKAKAAPDGSDPETEEAGLRGPLFLWAMANAGDRAETAKPRNPVARPGQSPTISTRIASVPPALWVCPQVPISRSPGRTSPRSRATWIAWAIFSSSEMPAS